MQSRSEQPSSKVGRIITADAVKIGGGMGNIARRISNEGATENLKSSDTRNLQNTHTGNIQDRVTYSPLSTINYQLSNYPRLRSRPLLAAMGRHTGQRIFRKQRKERLYG